eukprot:4139343-Alexandrium_andersonii.AAC.1
MPWRLRVCLRGQLAFASSHAPVEELMLPAFPLSFPRPGPAPHIPRVRVGCARVAPLVDCIAPTATRSRARWWLRMRSAPILARATVFALLPALRAR